MKVSNESLTPWPDTTALAADKLLHSGGIDVPSVPMLLQGLLLINRADLVRDLQRSVGAIPGPARPLVELQQEIYQALRSTARPELPKFFPLRDMWQDFRALSTATRYASALSESVPTQALIRRARGPVVGQTRVSVQSSPGTADRMKGTWWWVFYTDTHGVEQKAAFFQQDGWSLRKKSSGYVPLGVLRAARELGLPWTDPRPDAAKRPERAKTIARRSARAAQYAAELSTAPSYELVWQAFRDYAGMSGRSAQKLVSKYPPRRWQVLLDWISDAINRYPHRRKLDWTTLPPP